MKKILFVFVSVMLFACFFTLGVSAADFESGFDAGVTTYGNGPDWANVEDKDATAVIKLSDGSFVRVPAYYVFKSTTQFAADGSNFDFGWIGEQVGETVKLANLVAFEIPNGVASIGGINTSVFSALEELVVPTTVTSLPQKLLRSNKIVKRLFVKQTMDNDGNVVGSKAVPAYFADQGSVLEFFAFELDYTTYIGPSAFGGSLVTSLTFEGPMTEVGGYAFSSCPNLTTVVLNNTGDTITIGGQAFASANQLTSVTLNGFNLSNYLFENVKGLTGGLKVVATNVSTIGDMPFKNSTNLEIAEISGPITKIGSSMFLGCHNLTTATVNNTGSTVVAASGAFSELKSIKNVTLNGIELGYRILYKVTTLESVTLTNFGTVIGQEAFRGSNITSFTVPAGFTKINQHAFADCKSLATVTFAGDAGENAEIGYASFENTKALTTFVIPEGVTTLGDVPFKNAGIKYLTLPTTLTTLNGGSHFYGCPLETVTGLENTHLTSISHSMFRGQRNWKPAVLRIPDTVEVINTYGFADCGATVIKLGTGIKTIGDEAFVNCPNVREYYLPATITEINSSAFNNSVNKNTLFFVASQDADYVSMVKTRTGATSNAAITHEAYKTAIKENADAYANGKHVIYACNVCEVLYDGAHAMAGQEQMSFTSYFEPATIGDRCTRSGCGNMVVARTIDAIFTDLGYSCTEFAINGVYSVSQFYEIDKGAYTAYIAETGLPFEYGVVVSVSSDPLNPENSDLIDEKKTLITSENFFKYDYISINVSGFTESTFGNAFTFCMFVKDGEKISYLDDGKTVDTVVQKSYNDILAMTNSK